MSRHTAVQKVRHWQWGFLLSVGLQHAGCEAHVIVCGRIALIMYI